MIQSTKDYGIFKKNINNREIDRNNVDKLARSIKMNNLLKFRPILVNGNMEVVDGQHRLEAAKELGIEVYYQIQPELRKEDIYVLNMTQKAWGMMDFLNYYVNDGVKDYVDLKKFMEKHELTLGDAITILCLGSKPGGGIGEKFKKGGFKFPSPSEYMESMKILENVRTFIDFVVQKTPYTSQDLSTLGLKRSLIYFLNIKDVDFNTFLKKLEYKLALFKKCVSIKEYLKLFESIYNWKNASPISVDDVN